MNWIKTRKLGFKLVLGYVLLLSLMGILGLIGVQGTTRIDTQLGRIFNIQMPAVELLLEADRDLHQLLIAERSVLFESDTSGTIESFTRDYEENKQQALQRFGKYKALASTPEEREKISGFEDAFEDWQGVSKQVLARGTTGLPEDRHAAMELSLGPAKEKFETMRGYIDQLTEMNLEMAEKAEKVSTATYRSAILIIALVTGISLIVAIFLIWGVNRVLIAPLRRTITALDYSSEQVALTSRQLTGASQSLAEGASEQAASIEQTSSSLEELASMTRQNSTNAEQADRLMKESHKTVDNAHRSMEELIGSMREISAASAETSKIVKTIDEIAFQTNLLALNAAVEAARAGEAGAGFAVVAHEVRNLAMRASTASSSSAALIESIVNRIAAGSDLVGKTGDAIQEIVKSAGKVGVLLGEIAAASGEQAQGIEQINIAVTEMDKVVQQNASNSEESAAATEGMTTQAEQLKVLMDDLVVLVEGSAEKRNVSRAGIPERRIPQVAKQRALPAH